MKKLYLFILMCCLLVLPLAVATTITENQVTISSDKDTYFCEPVSSIDGCLFQTQLTVTNDRPGNIATKVYFDSNKPVAVRDYRSKGQSIAVDKSKGKAIYSQNTDVIFSGETRTYDLEFYANENGKFNYSVFFNGNWVILDPFFNVTYNSSSPTSHLVEGRVTQYNDSQFSLNTSVTTELTDGSDASTFEVSRTEFFDNAVQIFSFTGSTNYIGEISEKGDTLFASENIDTGNNFYYDLTFTSNLDNGDIVEMTFKDGNKIAPIYIGNPAQTEIYGNFTGTSNFEDYFITLSGLGSPKSSFRVWGDSSDTGDDEHFDFISVGETVEGKALRVTFPVEINTNHNYYLKVRKSSTGTAEFEVYDYFNNTDEINNSLSFGNIITGDNMILLNVTKNQTASFRIFTGTRHEISEVSLIENINDTVDPVYNGGFVNDTSLFCDDSIRLTVNNTDNFFIDTVYIKYNDTLGVHQVQADRIINTDLYFIDVDYNFDTGATPKTNYLAGSVAIDESGNTFESFDSVAYTYSCDQFPANIIGLSSLLPLNNTLINEFGFSPSVVSNTTGLGNLYLNNSLHETISLVSGLNIFSFVSRNNDSVTSFYVEGVANNTFTTGSHTVSILHPNQELNLILESPLNNSIIVSDLVEFTLNVNVTGNSTLYYVSDLNPGVVVTGPTIFSTVGSNTFPVTFTENQTISWFINHTFNPTVMSPVFNLSIVIPQPFQSEYTVGVCPLLTIPSTMGFSLIVLISFALIIIGLVWIPIIGIFGAMLFFVLSIFLVTCSIVLGITLIVTSLIMLTALIVRAVS